MSRSMISFRLDDEKSQEIESKASKFNTSKSSFIRHLICIGLEVLENGSTANTEKIEEN